jgi:hypothetical protein
MDVGAIAIVAGAAAGLLAAASVVVPGLWRLPWAELLPPLAVLFAPAALVAVREWASLRAVVVTDRGVIDVPLRGAVDVLHFSGIRRVRRDWLRGGVRLEGAAHQVVIPAALADDARAAIREQRASSMAHLAGAVDDPLQWL